MLQCDGFGVYETLNKKIDSLALMNCMAHIRREFFDALSNDAQSARTALTLIQLLYQVEEKPGIWASTPNNASNCGFRNQNPYSINSASGSARNTTALPPPAPSGKPFNTP
ncbi:MAG: transposase [Saprospirales bacterium]|nr:transposase [Saprospirales bacterium]